MTIMRNVADINPADRAALEHVLGQSLSDNHQVVVSVRPGPAEPSASEGGAAMTPAERRAFEAEMAQWDAASDEDFRSFVTELVLYPN